jgi:hypothetical protein
MTFVAWVMGVKVLMLICEFDYIHHKAFLCGILKPSDKKKSIMIQMHDRKKMMFNNLSKVNLTNKGC